MSRPRRTGRKRSAASAASAPLLFAFFLSGFAGLMHQVVWAKLLVRLIGSTAVAQATVLAVFMAGLAAGALFFGRRADRRAGDADPGLGGERSVFPASLPQR